MNLGLMLEETARRYPDKTAIILGDRRLSFAEVDEAANKVANALLRAGLRKGDRVVMLVSNIPEFVTTYFGIVRTGAIAVPLDTKSTISELSSLCDNCQPRVLVSESPYLEPVVSAVSQFKSVELLIDVSSSFSGQLLDYKSIMATGSAQRVEVEVGEEDIAHIFYTQGGTGHPKGAMLSHGDILAHAASSAEGFQQTKDDVLILFALPMYHAFGLDAVMVASVLMGNAVVMLPGLSLDSLMETIEKERVTLLIGVPYIFALAVQWAEWGGVKNDLGSLRLCVSGGSALSNDIARRFKEHFHRDLVEVWGLTEGVAQDTCQAIDGSGKPGSVGKPLSGWEVAIVDDAGRRLPLNQSGEVIISGPMMTGYYANPQATAEAIKDGWLYTGDIGRIDEDGELFITGRIKDMIIVKGQNVYPIDIEDVLYTHPKVAQAAVVGVYDETRGEKIRAFIGLKDEATVTERELKEFCREHLASYKVPKEIVFMDSLPRTAAGKIHKEALKQL